MSRFERLRSPSVDVVVDVTTGVPSVAYWGEPLGDGLSDADLEHCFSRARVPASVEAARAIPIVPMHADGFPGRPGLHGHRRGGRLWAPRFRLSHSATDSRGGVSSLDVVSVDHVAQLSIDSRFSLDADGILTISLEVVNTGDSPYMLDGLSVSVPFPETAVELGIFRGRWIREFEFDRVDWHSGAWTAENRSGRTSHEHPPFLWVLERETTESLGAVWGLHVAWSGNHVSYAEVLSDGRRYVQMGELFHPGEMCIDPGARLSTPEIIGVFSAQGINAASQRYHRFVRRRSPQRDAPRPVHLNTWEAVYFDHDISRLRSLADVAAQIGVERFVLDDGWFGDRRNDARGLGDWIVSPEVYPNGLEPLIDHVTSLGMEFGIWIEPEMANPDSTIVRDHPDWVSVSNGYEPVLGRQQVVLDLCRPEVVEHLFEQMDRLLSGNRISYVKWDMNRPLVQASNPLGKASSHQHVVEFYRLLDRLRYRHPNVEFESCASGGGRIDFEILKRVERVWTSDSNDALERQFVLHGASMMLPLEVLGSHIGPSPSHTTKRRHSAAFRGATALFGHLGIEADLTKFEEPDLADVAHIVAVYKRFRTLLHSGDFFRLETDRNLDRYRGRTALSHAVLAQDRSAAVMSIAQLATEDSLTPGAIRIPDLRPDARYDIEFVPMSRGQMSGSRLGPAIEQPSWVTSSVSGSPEAVTGRMLATVGLPRPVLWPESAIVVHLSCA